MHLAGGNIQDHISHRQASWEISLDAEHFGVLSPRVVDAVGLPEYIVEILAVNNRSLSDYVTEERLLEEIIRKLVIVEDFVLHISPCRVESFAFSELVLPSWKVA